MGAAAAHFGPDKLREIVEFDLNCTGILECGLNQTVSYLAAEHVIIISVHNGHLISYH